jgi:hypothetical protein
MLLVQVFEQRLFVEAVCFTHKSFQSIAVYGMLEVTLRNGNEHLYRCITFGLPHIDGTKRIGRQ